MAKVKICPICGAKFETSRPNKKYCCFTCKEAGAIMRRMKWKDQNPHYNAAYMKEYRKAKRDQEQNKRITENEN